MEGNGLYFLFYLFLRFYLFHKEKEREQASSHAGECPAEREGEAGFLQSRKPDAGFQPRTLGS